MCNFLESTVRCHHAYYEHIMSCAMICPSSHCAKSHIRGTYSHRSTWRSVLNMTSMRSIVHGKLWCPSPHHTLSHEIEVDERMISCILLLLFSADVFKVFIVIKHSKILSNTSTVVYQYSYKTERRPSSASSITNHVAYGGSTYRWC
jgi:hypothetical protein